MCSFVLTRIFKMADGFGSSGVTASEMYREMFPQYDRLFIDAVSSAVSTCGIHFFLRKEQIQAIYDYLKGSDVVVNLPTGYCKSLCYVLCPVICNNLRGVTRKKERSILLLISPLKALMDDQILSLSQLGLSCLKLTPNVSEADISRLNVGDVQVAILSPESFECVIVRRALQAVRNRIHCVAIDEAHCIEQWGKDFRSAYGKLGEVRALLLPKLPIMALTATVTKTSLSYIVQKLNMEGYTLIKGSNNRKNIFYSVSKIETYQDNDHERMEMAFATCFQPIIQDLKENGTSAERGIIFCFSHRDCSEVYEYFERELGQQMFHQLQDIKERLVDIYVKITSDSCKKAILNSFREKSGCLRIVIASVAFGMGVNCPDIRKVIHFRAPASLTSYVQESGRAGRDSGSSQAILFYSSKEFGVRKAKITKGASNPNELKELEAMKEYCENTQLCRRFCLLKHFDGHQKAKEECNVLTKHECCDICLAFCECEECVEKSLDLETVINTQQAEESTSTLNVTEYSVCKEKLKKELHSYKDSLSQDVLLVGNDLSTGFSDQVIDQILAVCNQVNNTEEIQGKVDVWNDEQANYVLSLRGETLNYKMVAMEVF